MSASERRAFEEGAFYDAGESMEEDALEKVRAEALRRYPDKPCKNVREIVVEYLKENGYKGLYDECWYWTIDDIMKPYFDGYFGMRPGVLREGKIVAKEGE